MSSPVTTPTSPLDWGRAGMLVLTLGWSVLALGGQTPLTFLGSLSLTVLTVLVHVFAALRSSTSRLPVPGCVWASVPFLLWSAISAAWISDAAWIGWSDWLRWTQGVALFWVASTALRTIGPRRLILVAVAVVAAIAVLLACHQYFLDPTWLANGEPQLEQFRGRPSGPFLAPTSFAGFLVLLIPASVALALRPSASGVVRVAASWLTAVLVFGLVLPVSRGAWIALAVAAAVWFLATARLRPGQRLFRVGVVVLGLMLLGSLLLALSPDTQGRFGQMIADRGEVTRPVLWRAAWEIFTAHPLLGSGGGSYNLAFESVRPEGFFKDPIWAHSEYLNLLSDYGLIGAFCVLLVVVAFVRALTSASSESTGGRQRVSDWSDSSALRTGIRVGLLALALHAAVDFHFRLPGLVVPAALLAGLAVVPASAVSAPRRWFLPRAVALSAAVAGVALGFSGFSPLLRGEAARREGRRLIDGLWNTDLTAPRYAQDLSVAEERLQAATALAAGNAQAWSDLAYVLTLRSHLEPARSAELGRLAEAAANRALVLGPGAWEPWLRRSVARDLQGRWFEAGDDSAAALARAPANAEVWYYHAYHLSHRRNERFIALAAAEFCLRLDPQNRAAQALRARLRSGDRGPH